MSACWSRRPSARVSVLGQAHTPRSSTGQARRCTPSRPTTPLLDGTERVASLATWVFLATNDVRLEPTGDEAYALVVAVAAGEIDGASRIAADLAPFARPAP
jgi:hypothetical protein